jgi:hypothetical protein
MSQGCVGVSSASYTIAECKETRVRARTHRPPRTAHTARTPHPVTPRTRTIGACKHAPYDPVSFPHPTLKPFLNLVRQWF